MAYEKFDWVASTNGPLRPSPGATPVTAAQLDHLETQYDEAVEYTDETIGNLDKSDIGLGNVDDTSDANKPVSTATQTALDDKADASVQTTVESGRLSESELNGTIATQVTPAVRTRSGRRKVVAIGDSHTAGVGPSGSASTPNLGFVRMGLQAAGTYHFSITQLVNAGIGGDTSAGMKARLAPLLAGEDVGVLLIEAGANDADPEIARSVSEFIANIDEMVNAAFAAGAVPALNGVPPKEASAMALMSGPDQTATRTRIDQYNEALRVYAQERGIPFVDVWPILADPTTFDLLTIYADAPSKHINELGHKKWGALLGESLLHTLPSRPIPVPAKRPTNRIANGWMEGAGSTGPDTGIASGWAQSTASGSGLAWTLETDTLNILPKKPDGTANRWQVATYQPTSAFERIIHAPLATDAADAAGDLVRVSLVLVIEDLSGDWLANCAATTAQCYTQILEDSTGNLTPSMGRFPGRYIGDNLWVHDAVWMTGPIVDPAQTRRVRVVFKAPVGAHYKIRFSAVEAINQTKHGLPSIT